MMLNNKEAHDTEILISRDPLSGNNIWWCYLAFRFADFFYIKKCSLICSGDTQACFGHGRFSCNYSAGWKPWWTALCCCLPLGLVPPASEDWSSC